MRSSWVYAFAFVLFACGGPEARDTALEAKEGGGKRAELAPYDDEPDADAGMASQDANAQALPDSSTALPDSAVQDAQAARDDADGPTVDAGAPDVLTGDWRVTLSPVGTPCAGDPVPAGGAWRVLEAEGSLTVDTPQGTLTGPAAAVGGVWSGRWHVSGALRVAGGLGGELERRGATCADRWAVAGVRP